MDAINGPRFDVSKHLLTQEYNDTIEEREKARHTRTRDHSMTLCGQGNGNGNGNGSGNDKGMRVRDRRRKGRTVHLPHGSTHYIPSSMEADHIYL